MARATPARGDVASSGSDGDGTVTVGQENSEISPYLCTGVCVCGEMCSPMLSVTPRPAGEESCSFRG